MGVVFSESQSLVVSVAAFRFPFCSNGVEFCIVETVWFGLFFILDLLFYYFNVTCKAHLNIFI